MSIEFGWILNLNHTQIGQMSFRLDFKQIKFVRQNILASRTSLTIWWMAAAGRPVSEADDDCSIHCLQTSDSRPTLFPPCSNLLRFWFPPPWPSDTPRVTRATVNTWTWSLNICGPRCLHLSREKLLKIFIFHCAIKLCNNVLTRLFPSLALFDNLILSRDHEMWG